MATKIVKIKLRGTHVAVWRLDRQVQAAVKAGMYETALFGLTAVERQIGRSRPKPVASNTYRLSWHAKKTKLGAVLGSSAKHAIQVEVGRRPGRAPPLGPLREWVLQKRLVKPYRPRGPKPRSSGDVLVYNSKKEDRKRKASHRRFLKATGRRNAQATAIAIRVARAIAKRGIQGRFVLANAMPRIQKMARRQTRLHIKGALRAHRG